MSIDPEVILSIIAACGTLAVGTAPLSVCVSPLVLPNPPPSVAPTDKLAEAEVDDVPAGVVLVVWMIDGG